MRNISIGALGLAATLAFAAPAFTAEDAYWQGQATGAAKLILNHGKKWQIDAPLREGMENILGAVARDIRIIQANKATPEQYHALAARVTGEVAGIVQNCRLEPAADQQLHIVLVDLLAGAEAMEGRVAAESPRNGAERVRKALNAYGEHFDHAGWARLEALSDLAKSTERKTSHEGHAA